VVGNIIDQTDRERERYGVCRRLKIVELAAFVNMLLFIFVENFSGFLSKHIRTAIFKKLS
jgi:hypothetical protein